MSKSSAVAGASTIARNGSQRKFTSKSGTRVMFHCWKGCWRRLTPAVSAPPHAALTLCLVCPFSTAAASNNKKKSDITVAHVDSSTDSTL